MRMWNLNPKVLCQKHLLGEHNEIHKAVGNLNHSGKWAKALIQKGFLEPQNFIKRHDELVKEMLRRGYKHNSPLEFNNSENLKGCVDVEKSLKDLLSRCQECKKRYYQKKMNKKSRIGNVKLLILFLILVILFLIWRILK